ncbi:reprolysin-like metallopeptidase [Pseudomonas putida]|uniref:reprolysin-like metallopeptidase n=1 Tax=Pseudomonas putida TaxID=303 RepID=UPI001F52AB9F|nr:M12 family metallo-peptidase [Pseudomonas putida]MCI0913645.1 hypothetical protein [Pseudomonas putida]
MVTVRIFFRYLLVLTLVSAGGCKALEPGLASATAGPLYQLQATPARDTLKATATGKLARLLEDPAAEQVTLINANLHLLDAHIKTLTVSVPGGNAVQFNQRRAGTVFENIDGWVGYRPNDWKSKTGSTAEIPVDPLYYLSVVRNGEKIWANLTLGGQPYRIEPIEGKQHVLVKIDESKLPKEAEPIREQVDVVEPVPLREPSPAQSVIRVLFVTTNQLRERYPDFYEKTLLALQDANQYLENSQVNARYENAGFFSASYDEGSKDTKTMLYDMKNNGPALGAAIHTVREDRRADLVSMLIVNYEYCGYAFIDSSKSSAFSTVSCYGVLAHELGHNFGAGHNNEGEKSSYDYGYRHPEDPRFRTIMSYGCATSCPEIAYHSNPRLTYQGQPMGTVAHNDVARRFNDRRETVANFYENYTPVTITLYKGENYQSQICSFTAEVGHYYSFNDSHPCVAAREEVRSMKVRGFRGDLRYYVYIEGPKGTIPNGYFGNYVGDFDVPSLRYSAPGSLPEGLKRVPNLFGTAMIRLGLTDGGPQNK